MSETKNCKLHLTDDNTERFQDWRNAMNGPIDSNMIKLDDAVGAKADKSVSVSVTLLSNAWSGSDAPYTQVLLVDKITADQNGIWDIAHSATAEQRDIARYALLSIIKQENNKLTFVADGELPEQDIPISIILFG